jgi:predicted nucleic acid-binding protein
MKGESCTGYQRSRLWDGLILSVAAEARCRILLSEDLQHDFTWRGVTVVNPYLAKAEAHPLLEALLNQKQ